VVGVPQGSIDSVLDSLKHAVIRGNDVKARRWVDKGGPSAPHRGAPAGKFAGKSGASPAGKSSTGYRPDQAKRKERY
jgi:hypothetical protein